MVALFMVAQQPAGDLVDEMDAGAGRTGHGFVAVRVIRRVGIRQLKLDIHAGPRAAKDQFAHLELLGLLSSWRIDLAQLLQQ
jgi:hypothetical protein